MSDANDLARVLCAIEAAQADSDTKVREAFRKACAEHETVDPYLRAVLAAAEAVSAAADEAEGE